MGETTTHARRLTGAAGEGAAPALLVARGRWEQDEPIVADAWDDAEEWDAAPRTTSGERSDHGRRG